MKGIPEGKYLWTATVGEKGQIVIPKQARDLFQIKPGDTLLINLSEHFRSEIQEQGKDAETLICYSIVNTLCRNTGMKRVRFFFEGEQVETVAGTIYWAGEFMYNIGLAEKGLG